MKKITVYYLLLIFVILFVSRHKLTAQSDTPCNAPFLTVEPISCQFQTFTTTGFTFQSDTANGGMPSCAMPGLNQPDVWFRFIVPLSGSTCITTTQDTITDGGMSLYGGDCSDLTEIECDDDDGQNMMPMIDRSDLIPGDTMYIRFWKGWGAGSGTFNICLVETHSDCLIYLPVCQNTTFANHPYGAGSVQEANYYTCFSYEQQSAWLRFRFLTGGTFSFLITPMNNIDDYDWAIFDGNDPDFCIHIDSTTTPISCNATSTTGCDGSTGLSPAGVSNSVPPGPGNPYNPVLTVAAGDTLFMLINNFSASNTGFYFTLGGTATLDCSQNHTYSLIASFSTTNISCNGCSDGAITVNVTGGQPPYTYLWSNGATTAGVTGLSAGNYSVTISDSSGIVDIASLSMLEPPVLTMTPLITNPSCYGEYTGAIDLWINCGTPPFTITWSNLATTEDLVSLGAGTYSVTVTDSNGNTGSASADITQPPELTISFTTTDVTNGGDGAVDLTINGGIPLYTVFWSTGSNAEDLDNIGTGTYSVTVTDVTGCYITGSVVIDSAGQGMVPFPEQVNGIILYPNKPNPFSETTEIRIFLPRTSELELAVFNILGEKCSTIGKGRYPAGIHRFLFNRSGLAPGIYTCRLSVPDGILHRQMQAGK